MENIKLESEDCDNSFDASPFRGRSNTWPLQPRVDPFGSSPGSDCGPSDCGLGLRDTLSTISESRGHLGEGLGCNASSANSSTTNIPTTAHEASSSQLALDCLGGGAPGSGPKKNTSRRNAWGNMSYADLITQAVQSSPDKRLTLSQIYDWMVQNVPYFKDKGDSNSSAGWKVRFFLVLSFFAFLISSSSLFHSMSSVPLHCTLLHF